MSDRPYTDADVETVATVLDGRLRDQRGVPPMVTLLHSARAVLDALTAAGWIRIDPDEPHVIEFRADGWTIQHPLRCRPDLFGCEVNRVGESLPGPAGPPPDGLGRYECWLADGVGLAIGDRRD